MHNDILVKSPCQHLHVVAHINYTSICRFLSYFQGASIIIQFGAVLDSVALAATAICLGSIVAIVTRRYRTEDSNLDVVRHQVSLVLF